MALLEADVNGTPRLPLPAESRQEKVRVIATREPATLERFRGVHGINLPLDTPCVALVQARN